MEAPQGQGVKIALRYPISERLKAAGAAAMLWGVAALWAAFMLKVALFRPATPQSGRPLALTLVACSVPFLIWGAGYWRRLVASSPMLRIDSRQLTICHEALLSAPLTIAHAHVSCVAVDETGTRQAHDELRFPVTFDSREQDCPSGEGRWLYSRYAGAPMPLLDTGEHTPNLAIVFKAPTLIDVARLKRRRPLQVNGGHQALYRREPALGLLLRVVDPAAVRDALSQSGLLGNVTEGDLVSALGVESYPSLSAPASEPAPRAVGRVPRRVGVLGTVLALIWLALFLARSQSGHFGAGRSGAVALGLLAVVAVRSTGVRAGLARLSKAIPFGARALLLYPAITSGAYALALAITASGSSAVLAYMLFPLAATAVLVLADASGERMASNGRVTWAIAASVPALALSGLAFSFLH
jgi:hypothetical protein